MFKTAFFAETYAAVVRSHIEFGDAEHIPWGISESSFLQMSSDSTYKYKLHGIPSLALKQYPYRDLVVSPYSSFLALEIFPEESYQNIARLQKIGAESNFGFYEAVDYNNYSAKQPKSIFVETFLFASPGYYSGNNRKCALY